MEEKTLNYNSKDMLRATVIPVLLGDCPAAHIFAAKVYLRCGIVSYVCDEKKKAADIIDPFSKFFCLHSRREPRVILDSLEYLSSVKDYLPIIIPCDKFYKEFTENNKDFLGTRFILSDKEFFFKQKPMSAFRA